MSRKLIPNIKTVNEELWLFISISTGVFLFILFFQPFPFDKINPDNRLMINAGLGAIIFLLMFFVRMVFNKYPQNNNQNSYESAIPSYLGGYILFILNSVAFAFYLRYVGSVNINFIVMSKVVLISVAPPVILRVFYAFKELKENNIKLINERKAVQKRVEKYEEDLLNKSIEFVSDNGNEKLNILIADVAFIKSSDNYVEIVYTEENLFKRKLIRNTLKNIEQMIKPYTNFLRCHRICIVNKHYIEKLNRRLNNYWLSIKNYNEQIPVSRQYMLKIKEAL